MGNMSADNHEGNCAVSQTCGSWKPFFSYLSFLRLFATDVSQALDLGLQLLRLSGNLLDFVGHLFTLLMDLVTLPGKQFKLGC